MAVFSLLTEGFGKKCAYYSTTTYLRTFVLQNYSGQSEKRISPARSLVTYYEAEGGVIELPETGAPYSPHAKAKIT